VDFLLVLTVNVYDRSGDGNHHFRDLETTANDVRKAEKTSFLTGNTIPSHY